MIKTKALTLFCVAATSSLTTLTLTSTPAPHPHVPRTVTMQMGPDQNIEVSHFTVPSNEEHLKGIEVGQLILGGGTLTLPADMKRGDTVIAAKGEYTIGAFRDGENAWTMALYPGRTRGGGSVDKSKAIKLESQFSQDRGNSAHAYFDLMPGQDKLDGKLTVIWQFGPLYLAGALN